jgi:HicA toxin of bacterial toxin-antitoxin,
MAANAEIALTSGLPRNTLHFSTVLWYRFKMKRAHVKTLELIFARPVSANVRWTDIEALFLELGAIVNEREGSRIAVVLFGQVQVYHHPHPRPTTDKGAIASIRKWLESNGVKP